MFDQMGHDNLLGDLREANSTIALLRKEIENLQSQLPGEWIDVVQNEGREMVPGIYIVEHCTITGKIVYNSETIFEHRTVGSFFGGSSAVKIRLAHPFHEPLEVQVGKYNVPNQGTAEVLTVIGDKCWYVSTAGKHEVVPVANVRYWLKINDAVFIGGGDDA